MDQARLPSLRERKKQQIRNRIVETTLSLMRERAFSDISPDDIALHAEVGRATFFRYFDSKEASAVVGFYEKRLTDTIEVLKAAPPELDPVDTVIWTFVQLVESDYRNERANVVLLGTALNTSASLRAKAIEYQSGYESAVAQAVAHRFGRRRGNDWRPQLLAAAAVAIVRTVMEKWAASGPDPKAHLPGLVKKALEELKSGFSAEGGL